MIIIFSLYNNNNNNNSSSNTTTTTTTTTTTNNNNNNNNNKNNNNNNINNNNNDNNNNACIPLMPISALLAGFAVQNLLAVSFCQLASTEEGSPWKCVCALHHFRSLLKNLGR